jgi:hypothetical protein
LDHLLIYFLKQSPTPLFPVASAYTKSGGPER